MRKEFEKVTPESVGIPSGAVMELLDELDRPSEDERLSNFKEAR